MQTDNQSTEGKDPQQTTSESSLYDAACSADDLLRRWIARGASGETLERLDRDTRAYLGSPRTDWPAVATRLGYAISNAYAVLLSEAQTVGCEPNADAMASADEKPRSKANL
jgi:hypothetical protein